jgi:hypothetical protein
MSLSRTKTDSKHTTKLARHTSYAICEMCWSLNEVRYLWYRLLQGRRGAVSESGRLCRGDESHGGGVPVTVKKAKRRTANAGLASAQASVTKLVTHVAQHDAIGRNMALRRPCAFDIATR